MPRDLALPADGIHFGIPMADYLRFDGWHKGDIEAALAESPAHVFAARSMKGTGSAATAFGTAVHAAVLEPDTFAERYGILPEGDGRTSLVRDAKAKIEGRGATAIKQEEWDAALAIRSELMKYELTRAALTAGDGKNEVTLIWTDKATGLRCVARPDRLSVNLGLILDLKTARDASPGRFATACAFYGYDVGTAHYLAGARALGLDIDELLYVVVPSEAPHIPYVYRMSDAWTLAARGRRAEGLAVLKACVDSQEWPAGNDGVITIEPSYGRKLELGMLEGR